MPDTRTSSETDAGRRFDGPLTIATAAGARLHLLDALDTRAEAIDLTAVSAIDGAGVQLLVMAAREAGRRGQPLRFEIAGGPVGETLALLRLDTELVPGTVA